MIFFAQSRRQEETRCEAYSCKGEVCLKPLTLKGIVFCLKKNMVHSLQRFLYAFTLFHTRGGKCSGSRRCAPRRTKSPKRCMFYNKISLIRLKMKEIAKYASFFCEKILILAWFVGIHSCMRKFKSEIVWQLLVILPNLRDVFDIEHHSSEYFLHRKYSLKF